MKKDILLAKLKLKQESTMADKILRYMLQPDDESIELTDIEKRRYDILKFTHAQRMRFNRKADIVKMLCHMYEIKDRQAYNYINEAEYVFSSLEDVNKDYERNYIISHSIKNIEIAMASRNSDYITKALLAHYRFCGLNEINIDMPDFSALEPSKINISLPTSQIKMLELLMSKGSLDFGMLIPHQEVTFDVDHEEIKDEPN